MADKKVERIVIDAPNFGHYETEIVGTAPLVQLRFSEKTKQEMMLKHAQGDVARSKNKREKKDFDALYKQSMHISAEGWYGIPAAGVRNAMISACRVAGVVMTKAKLCVFVQADGLDSDDHLTGLIKITHGEPKRIDSPVRNADGSADIRTRAMWAPGWRAIIRIQYDADQIDPGGISNLLMRAGKQVGLGEGRPDSKKSNGMGWGLFDLVSKPPRKPKKN